MKCYQWPLPQINDSFKKELLSFEKLRKKIDIIESFFEKRFSTPAELFEHFGSFTQGRNLYSTIARAAGLVKKKLSDEQCGVWHADLRTVSTITQVSCLWHLLPIQGSSKY